MTTISDVYDQYWPVVRARVAVGTARGYSSAYRRIAPALGHAHIDALTPLDVELAFSTWTGARSTRTYALSMLTHLCDVAMRARMAASNPCRWIRLPKQQEVDPS